LHHQALVMLSDGSTAVRTLPTAEMAKLPMFTGPLFRTGVQVLKADAAYEPLFMQQLAKLTAYTVERIGVLTVGETVTSRIELDTTLPPAWDHKFLLRWQQSARLWRHALDMALAPYSWKVSKLSIKATGDYTVTVQAVPREAEAVATPKMEAVVPDLETAVAEMALTEKEAVAAPVDKKDEAAEEEEEEEVAADE
jgi:hypothetical protein